MSKNVVDNKRIFLLVFFSTFYENFDQQKRNKKKNCIGEENNVKKKELKNCIFLLMSL